MNRLLVLSVALLALGLPSAAQAKAPKAAKAPAAQSQPAEKAKDASAGNWRRDVKQLALNAAETKAIGALLARQAEPLATSASEMKIIQAKLERLLLDKEPDREAIRQLVKSSLEWELQLRMAKIERAIELRKLLGPERWAQLQKLGREYLQAKRSGKFKAGDLGEDAEALLDILDRLE